MHYFVSNVIKNPTYNKVDISLQYNLSRFILCSRRKPNISSLLSFL